MMQKLWKRAKGDASCLINSCDEMPFRHVRQDTDSEKVNDLMDALMENTVSF